MSNEVPVASCSTCDGSGTTKIGLTCAECKGAATNGVDRSVDAGADRATRPEKPCCERIANGVWCTREDGHTDAHHWASTGTESVQPVYGPIERLPPLMRRHKGMT
jgi:RecJ-like exonuclease